MLYSIYCLTYTRQQTGGEAVNEIKSFILSVLAGVVSYYICKWLDREKQHSPASGLSHLGKTEQKCLGAGTPRHFIFCSYERVKILSAYRLLRLQHKLYSFSTIILNYRITVHSFYSLPLKQQVHTLHGSIPIDASRSSSL